MSQARCVSGTSSPPHFTPADPSKVAKNFSLCLFHFLDFISPKLNMRSPPVPAQIGSLRSEVKAGFRVMEVEGN